jgi:hypothetical protein
MKKALERTITRRQKHVGPTHRQDVTCAFMCMCIYVFYMCNNVKMIIVAILKHLKGI